MNLNYHEMTMNEPRNSPARRQQYLVICTVMAAAFGHSVLQAGGLSSVTIDQGVFPGGKFVYKYTKRDYAAAGSMLQVIGKDAGLRMKNETVDRLYAIYLDDPNLMGGRRQRFACGLIDSSMYDENKSIHEGAKAIDVAERQERLLATNAGRVPPTTVELEEDGAHKLWPKLEYKETTLPRVKALVVQFPYTDGFVSAIMLGYKVIPALRRAAAAEGAQALTVVSTCSAKESMCTHYAPLESREFLLGEEDTDTYLAGLEPEPTFDLAAGWRKLSRRVAKYLGILGWNTDDPKIEEL